MLGYSSHARAAIQLWTAFEEGEKKISYSPINAHHRGVTHQCLFKSLNCRFRTALRIAGEGRPLIFRLNILYEGSLCPVLEDDLSTGKHTSHETHSSISLPPSEVHRASTQSRKRAGYRH